MFPQIGAPEVVVVAVVALLVLGPSRLPGAARSLGRGIREFKQTVSDAVPTHEELTKMTGEQDPADEPSVRS